MPVRRNFVRIKASPVRRVYHLSGWARGLKCLLVALLSVAVQGVWAPALKIGFAAPDFGLAALSCLALLTNPSGGAWIGFLLGCLEGAMIAQTLGSHILSFMIAGFLTGWIPVWLERAHPLMPILAGVLVVGVAETLLFLMAPRAGWVEWGLQVIGKALYNGVLTVPLYFVLKRWIPPEPLEAE